MTGLLSALAGGGLCVVPAIFFAGVEFGRRRERKAVVRDAFAKGYDQGFVQGEVSAEQRALFARSERLGRMVADIFAAPPHPVERRIHPLNHPTFRAASFEDVIRKAGE